MVSVVFGYQQAGSDTGLADYLKVSLFCQSCLVIDSESSCGRAAAHTSARTQGT